MFPQNVWHLPNGYHVSLIRVLDINENVILIDNDKNIKLFYQDLIDLIPKICWSIRLSKWYYWIFEMIIPISEILFLFFAIFYFYFVIFIC